MEHEYALPVGTTLNSGTRIYKVESVLGSGGFGITYRATTTVRIGNVPAKVTFAIKEHFLSKLCERKANTSRVVYSNPVKEDVETSMKDFVSEARRLQQVGVKHDNIVKVNEVFEANNTAYYVMEYLDGESLRAYVKRHGKLSESETMAIMQPIIGAATCLHGERMTHLDIKPANVMLVNDEAGRIRPVLIDFGLSKHYDEKGRPTSTINTLGCTDGYAPTEQYAGIETFSPTADIYAIGATTWYCLTGRDPKKSTELREGELANALADVASPDVVELVRRATMSYKYDRSLGTSQEAAARTTEDNYETQKIDDPDNKTRIIGSPKNKRAKSSDAKLEDAYLREESVLDNSFEPHSAVSTSKPTKIINDNVAANSSVNYPKQAETANLYNGHDYVDLGLPSGLKWATCNVGANSPSEYGDHFAWGETTTKSTYTVENSKTYNKSIGDISGYAEYDAARANWGGSWRMPTEAEMAELVNKCKWTWTTQKGNKGYKVTGPNGNSIFLPAAGYRYETSLYYSGENGFYWSSAPYESNAQRAYYLIFGSGSHGVYWYSHYYGFTVRPVSG